MTEKDAMLFPLNTFEGETKHQLIKLIDSLVESQRVIDAQIVNQQQEHPERNIYDRHANDKLEQSAQKILSQD